VPGFLHAALLQAFRPRGSAQPGEARPPLRDTCRVGPGGRVPPLNRMRLGVIILRNQPWEVIVRKRLCVSMLAVATLALSAAPAFAFHCSVVKKPAGAGSAGTVTLDVVNGEIVSSDLNLNPAGHIRGAFASLTAVLPDGTVVGGGDVFWHKDLPDGAHNSGPGDSECDGVGIDDLAECSG
jgi:hypothetical protein